MKSLVAFLLLCCSSSAQLLLKGSIFDKSSSEPVPFSNIGIPGKPIGTVADENGRFELRIPDQYRSDSIKVSAIGYKTCNFLAPELNQPGTAIYLEQAVQELREVIVRSKNTKYKVLGTKKYSKDNCSGFADIEGNWKGSETAVCIKNKNTVLLESFNFFIIQNKYPDSLYFRLSFYKRIPGFVKGRKDESLDWVGPTVLRKPIVFKLGQKQGEFSLALRDQDITISGDFFISLECLMDEMEISKFCYAGTAKIPSYFKVKAFARWHKTQGTSLRQGGGGADFNVKVACLK